MWWHWKSQQLFAWGRRSIVGVVYVQFMRACTYDRAVACESRHLNRRTNPVSHSTVTAGILITAMTLQVILTGLTQLSPGESSRPTPGPTAGPEFFGIVGMDPSYTYNTDNENFPDQVNREFLELMMADIAQLGARWIRIEFHAEHDRPEVGPGPIDFSKYDWFINHLAPKYGVRVLAVLGSGLIGDNDPAYNFSHVNDPLGPDGSNYYINEYLSRVRSVVERYGNRLGAVELINEPNANQVLSHGTEGRQKAVLPANYGTLLRRSYEIVQEVQPEVDVVLGGMLYDNEYNTLPEDKEHSYDLDWLESVYGSQPVMRYWSEHGHFPFDAVGVHPYFLDPNEVINYLNQVHDIQTQFNDHTSRVWITEIGYPADPPQEWDVFGMMTPSESEEQQASFLSAIYTTVPYKAPFVERIFWFKYEDFPLGPDQYSGFGLIRQRDSLDNYGSYANPWPRKFAFSVYQSLAQPRKLPAAPVDPPAETGDDLRYFEDTGHTLSAPFLGFWQQNGGEQMLGKPITEPFEQSGRLVQYFERVRLEHFPEHVGTDEEIQLGRLGSFVTHDRTFERQPPGVGPEEDSRYFEQTGQYIRGEFLQFWEAYGGLERFGMPISPVIEEDGTTVQYFERARFEYGLTPDRTSRVVKLGKIGLDALEIPGWYR